MEPMLVPATTSTGTRSSSSTLRTPTWAKPWAEPPESTRPTRGLFGVSAGEEGATRRRARAKAPPAARRIGAHDSRAWDSRPVGHYVGRHYPFGTGGSRMSKPIPSLVAVLILGLALPATAAPPPNDACSAATTIPGLELPFTQVLDTTQATSDGDPAVACVTPAPGKSVWYTFRPETSDAYAFDTGRQHARRLPPRPHPLHGRLRRPDARRQRLCPRPPRGLADGRDDLHPPRRRSGRRRRPGDPDRPERRRPLPQRAGARRWRLRHDFRTSASATRSPPVPTTGSTTPS